MWEDEGKDDDAKKHGAGKAQRLCRQQWRKICERGDIHTAARLRIILQRDRILI